MDSIKQLSHDKYNNLKEEDKNKLRSYALTKLPNYLKNNERAIEFEIYSFIRKKISIK